MQTVCADGERAQVLTSPAKKVSHDAFRRDSWLMSLAGPRPIENGVSGRAFRGQDARVARAVPAFRAEDQAGLTIITRSPGRSVRFVSIPELPP